MVDMRRPVPSTTEEFSLDITHISQPLMQSEIHNQGEEKQSFLEDYQIFEESPSRQENNLVSADEQSSLKKIVSQHKKETGRNFISDERLEMFARQVIPEQKLQDIMNLQKNKRSHFNEILSNLLFSANNPFQAELPQIHDLSFQ